MPGWMVVGLPRQMKREAHGFSRVGQGAKWSDETVFGHVP
jgi:hypothetical protein